MMFTIPTSTKKVSLENKHFACASNDFRNRFRPVGKSSHKTALFYLMQNYFMINAYFCGSRYSIIMKYN